MFRKINKTKKWKNYKIGMKHGKKFIYKRKVI